jgi:hypothetical protein
VLGSASVDAAAAAEGVRGPARLLLSGSDGDQTQAPETQVCARALWCVQGGCCGVLQHEAALGHVA